MGSSGARYQIIIVRIIKNNDDAVKELVEARKYLDKQCGERFKVIASFYSRKNNLLPRITNYLLVNRFIDNPLKTLYLINKCFINDKRVNFFQASTLGFIKELEEWGRSMRGIENNAVIEKKILTTQNDKL